MTDPDDYTTMAELVDDAADEFARLSLPAARFMAGRLTDEEARQFGYRSPGDEE